MPQSQGLLRLLRFPFGKVAFPTSIKCPNSNIQYFMAEILNMSDFQTSTQKQNKTPPEVALLGNGSVGGGGGSSRGGVALAAAAGWWWRRRW